MGAISSVTKFEGIIDLISDLSARKNLNNEQQIQLDSLRAVFAGDESVTDEVPFAMPKTGTKGIKAKRTKRNGTKRATKSTKNGGEKTTNQKRYACSPKGHNADLHAQYVAHIATNCGDRIDAKRDEGNPGSYFFAPTLQCACLLRFGSYADGSDRPSGTALSPGSDKFVMNDGLFDIAEEAGFVD